jgi:hypothetical protein
MLCCRCELVDRGTLNAMMLKMLLAVMGSACALAFGDEPLVIYGYEYARVGDPGNRATTDEEIPMFPGVRIGAVEYEFSLGIREVSLEEQLEFVQAYYPFHIAKAGGSIADFDLSGEGINAAFGFVELSPGHTPNEPAHIGWEYAARYINWLHHGKVVEAWAFETGVYDASTFVRNDDGVWQHQQHRSPGARFFMPTLDEWTKGAYWDPSKSDGAGGYWRFPNGSDDEPLPGLPSEGGERNAGERPTFPLGVMSYPDVRSPWGMVDMAGGRRELSETARRVENLSVRRRCGDSFTNWAIGDPYSGDQLGFSTETGIGVPDGLRLAVRSAYHPADLNEDGVLNFFDVSRFIRLFIEGDPRADLRLDQQFNIDDVRVYIGLFAN